MRPFTVALILIAAARLPAQPPPALPTPVLPIPTRDIVAALIGALADTDADVRMNAAVSLANVGADAVEPLTATLRGPNANARAAAAYSLGQIGGAAAPAADVVKALKDDDKEVRRLAAEAVGRVVAGANPQPSGPSPLAPPVPIDAPPPAPFPEKPRT